MEEKIEAENEVTEEISPVEPPVEEPIEEVKEEPQVETSIEKEPEPQVEEQAETVPEPETEKEQKPRCKLCGGSLSWDAVAEGLDRHAKCESKRAAKMGPQIGDVIRDAGDNKVRVVATHCDICGKKLPLEEIQMMAHNHRECWRNLIIERRGKQGITQEDVNRQIDEERRRASI